MPGAGEAGRIELGKPVPEKADAYPESNMFDAVNVHGNASELLSCNAQTPDDYPLDVMSIPRPARARRASPSCRSTHFIAEAADQTDAL